MHIHGNSFNLQAASLSAGQELKAAQARRAADVRKKLLKSTAGLEGVTDPEESLLMNQWLNARPGNLEQDDEYHSSLGRESTFR
jgi:hypothetical protein